MPTLSRCMALAAGLGLGVVVGCGSSSGSGSGSGCDAYFQAAFLSGCDEGPLPPQSEIARIQGIFETICANEEALPGSGFTDAVLGACASAITAVGCGVNVAELPACQVTGSLAPGAACSEATQCQSGSCDITFTGDTLAACGTCAKAAGVGQPCPMMGTSCEEGATCDLTSGVCKMITFGAAGASCEMPSQECGSGTFCVFSTETATCTAPGGMGAACVDSVFCQSPLGCIHGKCGPRSASGGPCNEDGDCASGLGCNVTTSSCGSVTWVSAGAACGNLTRCLVGECDSTGKCPTVIPDGQSCAPTNTTAVCDTLSNCTAGKCTLPGTSSCK
jgi:hypothetical protein